jgi:hypothetical protein
MFDTWIGVEDAEERNNTSLDPLYLEEWIDVELLCRVRQLHQGIKVPNETELKNYDKLDDCLSINHSGRDKRKFVVMNTPGFRTIYHSLPGGLLSYEVVRDNSPYKRKVIWNEEWNFEEIIENDRPDWVVEIEEREAKEQKDILFKRKLKYVWNKLNDLKVNYKLSYDAYDNTHNVQDKLEWDKLYKEYKKYSNALDQIKAIENHTDKTTLTRHADMLLHLFVELQQKCPDELVDSVLREDVKAKYKKEWYERTRYYLVRLIRRAEVLNQQKKYEEEEEATA